MKTKYFLFILFAFVFISTHAQHTITGQIEAAGDYKTMLLYKTEGAFQYYKASSPIDEKGLFGFALPENFEIGFYKLVYDAQKDLSVSFIYDNEDISFFFNPSDVSNSIYFYDSDNNSLFYDYIKSVNKKYLEIDSIQTVYYSNRSKKVFNAYIVKKNEIDAYQNYFEKKSEGKLVFYFIKAFKKHIKNSPLLTKDEYYTELKNNYLNEIDFQNPVLRNSSFLIDRLNEYIFDLNELIARKRNEKIDVNMIDFALRKIEDSKFKNEVIYSLTSSAFDPYSARYDVLLNHLNKYYYSILPENEKNENFTKMLEAKLNVIVGKKAPNISIGDSSLYAIKADTSLVIFWSSTCSHCLKEIPEIYKMLSSKKSINIVMVGIENEYSDWENVIKSFPNWIHKRANGKWKNKYAIAYNVKGTPSYFVLDKNKIIIAKPEKLKDVEDFFFKKDLSLYLNSQK